jgi:hypothetical protein
VQGNRLADLLTDAHDRVERIHRALEDNRQFAPAVGAHFLFRERHQVDIFEENLPADARVGGQQAQDRHQGGRLAAARFAHQPKRLAGMHLEGDILQRPRRAFVRR